MYLLRYIMKSLRREHELHCVWNGLEALDFLHRRGGFADARRPHLILLDINMPRMGGLEALTAIKSDPELRVIPVIILSTSAARDDVLRSYQAGANGYIAKPSDLQQSVSLVHAIESFWMDVALLPEPDDHKLLNRQPTDSKTSHPLFPSPE